MVRAKYVPKSFVIKIASSRITPPDFCICRRLGNQLPSFNRATYKQVMPHRGHHKNSQLHRELGLSSEHVYTCDFCIRCWTSKSDKSRCNTSRRRTNNAVDADRSQVKFKSGEISEIKSKLTHPVNRVIK